MSVGALFSLWAFLPLNNIITEGLTVEISKPPPILSIMIEDAMLMGMGFGIVTGMKFKVIKVEILNVEIGTLTMCVCVSL